MIDLEKCKKEFLKYTEKFDFEKEGIKRKQLHSLRVMEECKKVAKALKLNEEEIELAELIGLLHDIGRFEQYNRENEYHNEMILDHANLGVEILVKDDYIKKYIDDKYYIPIILKAIKNHNKLEIEDDLNEEELLYAKIIRDADKLDNFRVKEENKFEDSFPETKDAAGKLSYSAMSDVVYNDFLAHKCIKLEDRKTLIDYWVCILAFIFDLYFKSSLKYIKDKNYIDILIDKIEYKNEETKARMEDIRKCAKKYIEDNI